MKRALFAVAVLLLSAVPVRAADIEVGNPFIRAVPVAGGNGAAFLTIINHGDGDQLIGAEAPVARTLELHTHVKDGDVFRMRKVEAIDVPAHGTAELKPGGDHVMLIGVADVLKAGATVPLTLVFKKAGKVTVEVPVMGPGAMGHESMHDAMHGAGHGAGHGDMHH